jgi:glycine dehydrogenase subunit 2
MIEPPESESKEMLDKFIEIMIKISNEAKTNPELLTTAPHNTPIRRTNDLLAAKRPILTYDDELKLKDELKYKDKNIDF